MNDMSSIPAAENLQFVEELYEKYLRDRNAVSPDWQRYFASQDGSNGGFRPGPSFRPPSIFHPPTRRVSARADVRSMEAAVRQDRVDQLVRGIRVRGHMV